MAPHQSSLLQHSYQTPGELIDEKQLSEPIILFQTQNIPGTQINCLYRNMNLLRNPSLMGFNNRPIKLGKAIISFQSLLPPS